MAWPRALGSVAENSWRALEGKKNEVVLMKAFGSRKYFLSLYLL